MAALRTSKQGISKFRLSPLQLELVPGNFLTLRRKKLELDFRCSGENSKAGKDPTNDFATRVQTTKCEFSLV